MKLYTHSLTEACLRHSRNDQPSFGPGYGLNSSVLGGGAAFGSSIGIGFSTTGSNFGSGRLLLLAKMSRIVAIATMTAITPITIPAIAPPLRLELFPEEGGVCTMAEVVGLLGTTD